MIFLALLVILLAVFYQNRIQKIKKEEAQSLLKASLEAEIRERKRIASDLHDGIAGDLSAIRNFIEVLKLKKLDEESEKILKEIEIGINYTLQDIKNISQNLMPSHLETLGLIETIKHYVQHLDKLPNLTINLNVICEEEIQIIPSISYEIFRVIQELVSNIINHNNALIIEISFDCDQKDIFINIIDDGKPFKISSSFKSIKGKGVKNIFSRIQHINGQIEQPKISNGNHIKLTITKLP